jgi:peptide deformylase
MMDKLRLKLVQVGEEVLRRPARELTASEIKSPDTRQLIAFMRETLRDAPGVGLAAPQVGVELRLAIIEDVPEYSKNLTPEQMKERERVPVEFHVIVNPEIVRREGPMLEFFEGCLSLNGYSAMVPRYRSVEVRCFDEHAQAKTIHASGWYARILQHEIDHLNGIVYIDRMHSRTFMTVENLTRNWKDVSSEEVLKRLHAAEPRE